MGDVIRAASGGCMKKEELDHILILTRDTIRHYWNHDRAMLMSYLHPEALTIGMNEDSYFENAEAYRNAANEPESEQPLGDVRDEHYEIVYAGNDTALVCGRYTVYTNPDSEMVLVIKKRVSFLWEKTPTGLVIRHIHLSEGIPTSDDHDYISRAGRETYQYMMDLMRQHGDMVKVTVKDTDGVTHIISENDILRISTEGNYTTIYCFDRVVRMKKPLKYVKELLHTNIFIDISRSTIINAEYVEKVGGDTITMLDHTEIHISSRKVRDVLKKIRELTEL